jgi:hypothetical protein
MLTAGGDVREPAPTVAPRGLAPAARRRGHLRHRAERALHLTREPDPKGDRVDLVMSGKFLTYRTY